ncbi:hypothetical protein SASPL_130781 [Salvia splendens]|uniref:TF-B3 domain-containing protein n=1 Tax=Salvia splendens TaxID=180675 RepID=A0A8X8X6P8_SALSN|nr:hypothetical protein SASPL_130781 [Salvia splendens]
MVKVTGHGDCDHCKFPSFLKWFDSNSNVESLRLSPQWVRDYGEELPINCTLAMPNGLADYDDGLIYEREHEVESDLDTTDDYSHSESEAEDEHPSFVVVLSKSDIKGSLDFSLGFWAEHICLDSLQGRFFFMVDEKIWKVNVAKHNDKIRVTQGWSRFVRDNKLAEGNRCHFRLVDVTLVHFCISIEREEALSR